MLIRTAVQDDIPAICGLYEEFYAYNAGLQPEYYRAGEENGDYPRHAIQNDGSEIFVAVEDKAGIIGFIHVEKRLTPGFSSLVRHEFAEVVDIIVTKAHRQRGVGSMLMEKAKEWAKSLGLDYLELFVLKNAEGEIKFYEREGFEAVSQTMRYTLG